MHDDDGARGDVFTAVLRVPRCNSPPRGGSDQLQTPGSALFWHRGMSVEGSNKSRGPGPLIGVNTTPGARTAGASGDVSRGQRGPPPTASSSSPGRPGGQIRRDNKGDTCSQN